MNEDADMWNDNPNRRPGSLGWGSRFFIVVTTLVIVGAIWLWLY